MTPRAIIHEICHKDRQAYYTEYEEHMQHLCNYEAVFTWADKKGDRCLEDVLMQAVPVEQIRMPIPYTAGRQTDAQHWKESINSKGDKSDSIPPIRHKSRHSKDEIRADS